MLAQTQILPVRFSLGGVVVPPFTTGIDGFRVSTDNGVGWATRPNPPGTGNLTDFAYSISAASKANSGTLMSISWSITNSAARDFVLGFAGLNYTGRQGEQAKCRLTLTSLVGGFSFVNLSAYAGVGNTAYEEGWSLSSTTKSSAGTGDGSLTALPSGLDAYSIYLRLRVHADTLGTTMGTISLF